MNTDSKPFLSVQLDSYILRNRMVMAPMTRLGSRTNSVPIPINVTYYAQRTTAGLLVTECTMSPQSQGYMNCPGIYSLEQVRGWRQVTSPPSKQCVMISIQCNAGTYESASRSNFATD